MSKITFIDNKGTFSLKNPDHYSYLYFPVAGEKGIKSAVTPNLGGDSKLNQNAFLLEPVSAENLHNNRSGRNFWCRIEGKGSWSAVGQSAEAEYVKYTEEEDDTELTAGLMWHKIERTSKKYRLKSEVISFVPLEYHVELMHITIENVGEKAVEMTPFAAIPIYGRSADNIRDHRHVTSLLHRIRTTEHGVLVHPTLSFDERGHQKNQLTYFVCGVNGEAQKPVAFYPTVEEYVGEGRSFTYPTAVLSKLPGVEAGTVREGQEAVGAFRFADTVLEPGQKTTYTVILGATEHETEIAEALGALDTTEKVKAQLLAVEEYWQREVNITYHTKDADFDNFMRWVSFQPFLRRIYGCSFLPYHDYGKGGRGWRDLWQDCLALLMMNPSGVRQMIVDNYGGVRIDGTNATIIGEKQGQFIADRNNITRVWMDHGVWPFMTTKLYIDQTGDVEILNQQVPYFKDRQVERGTAKDEEWEASQGSQQRDDLGNVYRGTILEHILLQHLCAFYEVGDHNHIRLRGADWNDAMDMAEEKGESVAFTCAYAGNMKQLACLIRVLKEKCGQKSIRVMKEIARLLNRNTDYSDVEAKRAILSAYGRQCRHEISGQMIALDMEELASTLEQMADWMIGHIRSEEWIADGDGNGWFNGYYGNHGRQVEGILDTGVRMILTGQVFAIMSKTADKEQTKAICNSADHYLYKAEVGGYRINTDFKEEKYDCGRMFGFAYGEKENGAVFSHMTVMFANALYQNGFVKEGQKALQTLADTALNFSTSKIYPGIPEYFNAKGTGMYHYLTGAASWYMLTMVTEVFGVRGELGNLVLEPKLLGNQFDESGKAAICLTFAGKEFQVTYCNETKKDFGEYKIEKVLLNRKQVDCFVEDRAVLERSRLEALEEGVHQIEVVLV